LQKFYSKRIHSREESFPQLASNASYSLAFYYFTNKDYRKAHTFILQAKEIDYQFELLHNFAFDLWLEAQISLAGKNISEAIALFNQAKVIFIEFNNESMEAKINKILRQYSL